MFTGAILSYILKVEAEDSSEIRAPIFKLQGVASPDDSNPHPEVGI
jgi:hypothetical protein